MINTKRNFTHRLYCNSCCDYTLHEFITIDKAICSCGNNYVETPIENISSEVVNTQRNRYKRMLNTSSKRTMEILLYNILSGNYTCDIIESDAGLEAEIMAERQAYYEKKKADKEYITRYKNLGRNDKCVCNSGLKYKKCCYKKVENLKLTTDHF